MKLIILDRDGVINHDSSQFIKSADEWQPITGSISAIARLYGAGYRIVVATNQSGLARGLFEQTQLHRMHDKLYRLLAQQGAKLDAIFYCPHGPNDNCGCRKPQAGLLHRIAQMYRCDLQHVPLIGDSYRDLQAAQAVGAQPILVKTGKGEQTLQRYRQFIDTVPVFSDLTEVVDSILESR